MATGTGPRHCSVIEAGYAPTCTGVAGIAGGAGRHMAGGLALGCCAVMTAGASPGHCSVIHGGRNPTFGRVAVVAGAGALDMG